MSQFCHIVHWSCLSRVYKYQIEKVWKKKNRDGIERKKENGKVRGGWEANERKRKEKCQRKVSALPVDKRRQIINNALVYVAVRGRSTASETLSRFVAWSPSSFSFFLEIVSFFPAAEAKLHFTVKITVRMFQVHFHGLNLYQHRNTMIYSDS